MDCDSGNMVYKPSGIVNENDTYGDMAVVNVKTGEVDYGNGNNHLILRFISNCTEFF